MQFNVALAQEQIPPQSVVSQDEAEPRDAKEYAKDIGIDLSEATRRLKLQAFVGALDTTLSEKESDVYAGLWIEHTPQFKIIVQAIQGNESLLNSYVKDISAIANIIEFRSVKFSLAHLKKVQNSYTA